jgi:hypothetical protein
VKVYGSNIWRDKMKLEFELPDYCQNCMHQDLSIKQINAGTFENPTKKVNILECYYSQICAMWHRRLTIGEEKVMGE